MKINFIICNLFCLVIGLYGCGPEKSPVKIVDQKEGLGWEQNIDDVRAEQKRIITEIYKPDDELRIEYYNDSIVKTVESIVEGRIFGVKLEFRKNGNLQRRAFIGQAGKEVGDETIYSFTGEILYHYFKENSNRYLFRMEFCNGKLSQFEGKPWYIVGHKQIKLGDTAIYSIACPLVPGHTTHVEFEIFDNTSSPIRYINDIRQIRIKIPTKKVGVVNCKLTVIIKNENQQIVVKDSKIFSIQVVP